MNYQTFRSRQKDFISENGLIKFTDIGSGPTILLVHGFPVSSWIYHKLIPILKDAGYRVIAPDLLGYGSSDSPKNKDLYEPKNQGRLLLALMHHLQISKWSQVTHDFGGPVTWEMMRMQGESINHLFILNTILLASGFNPPFVTSVRPINKLISWLYSMPVINKILVNSLMKTTLYKLKPRESFLEGVTAPWTEGKTYAIEHFLNFINDPFYPIEHILGEYSGELNIIWGKYDEVLQWETQKRKLKSFIKIDDSSIHLVEGSHYIQYENADKVGDIICKEIVINGF